MNDCPFKIENNRMLIVDDNESIHEDFKKILMSPLKHDENEAISKMESALFDQNSEPSRETLYKRFAQVDYIIEDAYQGNEAVQLVQRAEERGTPYALIFMDVRMPPGMDGIEAIEKIWQINPFIEIVICTAYSDYSWEEIIRRTRPSDRMLFLKKPFYSVEVKQMALSLIIKRNLNEKIRELIANLEGEVDERTKEIQKVMTELKEANLELQSKNKVLADIVERDNLTGLYNHSAIHRRLNEWFDETERNFFPMGVIMMDVDNFKEFNDNFGHQAGDEILLELSAVLKRELHPDVDKQIERHWELRKYDVAARYGGDEFIVVLPYCGQDDAEKVANRLMKRFQDIELSQSIHMTLSVSMGVVVAVQGSKIQSSKALVRLADQALYDSKVHGRNQITFLHPE